MLAAKDEHRCPTRFLNRYRSHVRLTHRALRRVGADTRPGELPAPNF
jgi:hypothetical protein